MEAVVFKNQGEMDVRAMTTFGVSSKVNKNPIGFFGTGLKYAISILIRNEVDFKVFIGKDIYSFEKKEIDMRGKAINLVLMNGAELPFSTDLGKNWELWQAFRELYCNALDENGNVSLIESPEPEDDTTQIIVEDKRFHELYFNRHSIVLEKKGELLLDSPEMQIFNRPSKSAYYRGVRVFDFDIPSKYTYNVLEEHELTEDRTMKNQNYFMSRIAMLSAQLVDEATVSNILTASGDFMESHFNFNLLGWNEHMCSDVFFQKMEALYNENQDSFNVSAKHFYMEKAAKKSARVREKHDMNEVEQMQMDKAMAIVRKVYPEVDRYKILVVKDLGQKTMALADSALMTMIFSKRIFAHGTKYLVSTIIEEYFHLFTGHADETRALQTYLFDQITTFIEQYVIREPI